MLILSEPGIEARRVRLCSWFLDGDEKPKTKSDPRDSKSDPRDSKSDPRDSARDSAGRESPSCLALHGLGGGPYEIGPLIDALKADGLRVEAPILPGHEPLGPVMPALSWRE